MNGPGSSKWLQEQLKKKEEQGKVQIILESDELREKREKRAKEIELEKKKMDRESHKSAINSKPLKQPLAA